MTLVPSKLGNKVIEMSEIAYLVIEHGWNASAEI